MDTKRLSEIEYALEAYFRGSLLPVMRKERDALQEAQASEVREDTYSFSGFMGAFAGASNPDAYGMEADMARSRAVTGGTALGKTDEDYIEACLARIASDDGFRADLTRLAGEWRTAVVAQVGRERYERASEAIGGDLALAYIDHRMEQLMIDRMVRDRMPKSSFEYVLRKGVSQSLLGLAQLPLDSPLAAEIDARGEAAYRPTKNELRASKGVTFIGDAAALGGFSSWGSLVRTAGFEVGFHLFFGDDGTPVLQEGPTVEDCISQGVFGSEENVFTRIISDSRRIKSWESEYLQSLNDRLDRRMPIMSKEPFWENWDIRNWDIRGGLESIKSGLSASCAAFQSAVTANGSQARPAAAQTNNQQTMQQKSTIQKDGGFTGPPTAEEYFAAQTPQYSLRDACVRQGLMSEDEPEEYIPQEQPGQRDPDQQEPDQPTNESGWGGLLSSVGLDGIGDVGRNLGYVMAMLPDMLFGFFTGGNRKFNIGDNLMPLASVLLGLFVKNPVLKMVFIGMGGANLLNKAGHEALGNASGAAPSPTYRQYEDEPLNPRITSPEISGNTLIAYIDRVPYSITLPANVTDAYRAGALPLNTLANAVLAQHDRQQAMAQDIYNQQQNNDHNRNIQIR